MFSSIRQVGGSNNCEEDGAALLENLQDFLNNDKDSFSEIENVGTYNELHNFEISIVPESNINDCQFDTQEVAYVCGFIIKKIRLTDCNICRTSLLTHL